MNKILGYFNKAIGTLIDYILQGFIYIVNFLVSIFSSFRQIIGLMLSMSGCLVLLFIFNPIFFGFLLSNPFILTIIILSVVVPFIGKIAVSYLKYIKYMATEYFYDKADFYLLGRRASFEKMEDYGKKYRDDMERERIKREEARRKREEEEFKKRFENMGGGTYWTFGDYGDFEEFFRQAQQGGGYYQGSYNGQYQNQGNYQGYTSSSFKSQYEQACNTLGVGYNADKYEIKLAYKKMAKMYHPDINKEPGATEMFQKINSAYEFLNDANIQKYKTMN
ncbi:DnaJ domain-containing protein [Peptoniphilus sp. oral taxon 386]|uniref:DnaJ domain-containing protein n=1 Tax=Peptoniphilus sp. oral taxon 386 TaxID=652713 RepID=UPI0001DA9ECD|nr:DnaJ domain-containing protein [Peptoniphilus sp. oral taxon 386]EFI41507.1 DnaJ domain protein [Peptoniphilus sp. oral taxon 386 str. F0131]